MNKVLDLAFGAFGTLLGTLVSSALVIGATAPRAALAQSVTNTAEGIQNGIDRDIDSKDRNPVLSVTSEIRSNPSRVALLVDAHVRNREYVPYPIKFEFFVNRQLFATQIRSPQLPGPVGVDIGTDRATIPFNYSVVATVLHPNRQFISIIEGAVFGSDLATTLECTAIVPASAEDDATEFTSSDAQSSQTGDRQFSVSFVGTSGGEDSQEATFKADITLSSFITDGSEASDGDTANASGTFTVTRNGTTQTVNASGSVITTSDKAITSIDMRANADQPSAIELSCTTLATTSPEDGSDDGSTDDGSTDDGSTDGGESTQLEE